MFFVGNTEIQVSPEDLDLLIKYRWKLSLCGFIMEDREAYSEWDEEDIPEPPTTPYRYLHIEIGKRMGIFDRWEYTKVNFRNSNQFDCRRENLFAGDYVEKDPDRIKAYKDWYEEHRELFSKFM